MRRFAFALLLVGSFGPLSSSSSAVEPNTVVRSAHATRAVGEPAAPTTMNLPTQISETVDLPLTIETDTYVIPVRRYGGYYSPSPYRPYYARPYYQRPYYAYRPWLRPYNFYYGFGYGYGYGPGFFGGYTPFGAYYGGLPYGSLYGGYPYFGAPGYFGGYYRW